MSEMMNERWKQLHARVDDDGLCDDRDVETEMALPMSLTAPDQYGDVLDFDNKFVAVLIDNGAVDIEVRLPFEMVKQMAAAIDAGPASPPQ